MMDTMAMEKKKRVRRNHTPALKAQILAECEAPGASVARVAQAHGINANIVHCWRKLARESRPVASGVQVATPVAAPAFVPLAVQPAPLANERIHIELRCGALSMIVTWPATSAGEMASWMREVLRGESVR